MQAKHLLITGSSGGGKTTKMHENHLKHKGISIWVNWEHPKPNVEGIKCYSMEDMVNVIKESKDLMDIKINFITNKPPLEAPQDAIDLGWYIGEYFDSKIPTQIIVDEAQEALPDNEKESAQSSGNPIAKGLHQGRDMNIKIVLGTQDPQDLFYTPIKQIKHLIWCGETKVFHEGFLRYFGMTDLDMPKEQYEYIVVKPSSPPKIIYRGTTDSQYAPDK